VIATLRAVSLLRVNFGTADANRNGLSSLLSTGSLRGALLGKLAMRVNHEFLRSAGVKPVLTTSFARAATDDVFMRWVTGVSMFVDVVDECILDSTQFDINTNRVVGL
jgi:hypothetical protein